MIFFLNLLIFFKKTNLNMSIRPHNYRGRWKHRPKGLQDQGCQRTHRAIRRRLTYVAIYIPMVFQYSQPAFNAKTGLPLLRIHS